MLYYHHIFNICILPQYTVYFRNVIDYYLLPQLEFPPRARTSGRKAEAGATAHIGLECGHG